MEKSIVSESSKSQLELEKLEKYEKLEKLWEETERQSKNQHTIFDEVDTNIKKLPLLDPSLAELQNPGYSHKLYHKTIQMLKRSYIPRGKDGKEIRDKINLFLKQGMKTGRDSRQAYTKLMIEAINIFKGWINDYNGKQLIELVNRFEERIPKS